MTNTLFKVTDEDFPQGIFPNPDAIIAKCGDYWGLKVSKDGSKIIDRLGKTIAVAI